MNNNKLRNKILGIANYTRPTERQRKIYMEAVLRNEEMRERMQADLDRRIATFSYEYSSAS
jgi:hypothetical protein